MWNGFPAETKQAISLNMFKKTYLVIHFSFLIFYNNSFINSVLVFTAFKF